jgi:hypothetical protein
MTLVAKYLRGHNINVAVTDTQAATWFMRVIYEFWGFCMHGDQDPLVPGGFAPPNGINLTAAFHSASLLATGTQGYTRLGEPYFRDDFANFTSGNLEGKHIVAWSSGSTSNDNNIYHIKRVYDSGTLLVNVNQGATPYSGSLHPLFTARSSLRYRIVDFASAAQNSTAASGSFLILKLDAAKQINVGTSFDPQVKIATNGNGFVVVSTSPSGSWTGTQFLDETVGIAQDYFDVATAQTGHMSLIAADDFIISHIRGGWGEGAGFHVEVPERLYPQEFDPNPIVHMNRDTTSNLLAAAANCYSNGFTAYVPPLSGSRSYSTQARSPVGVYFHNEIFGQRLYGIPNGRYNGVIHNSINDRFYLTDGVLGRFVTDEYHLMRYRLRRVRFTGPIMPQFTRLGDSGEYIHVSQGVCWPWDNAILPDAFLVSGV